MIDDRTYRVLENELEFSNWGLCLDTGHLLVSLRGSDTEESALEMLNECVESYPKEMIERIKQGEDETKLVEEYYKICNQIEEFPEKCIENKPKNS